jgi:hypothetical protein
LNKLKEISIDMHNLWRSIGSPRNGSINSARLTAKRNYKQAIKIARVELEKSGADELHISLNSKDNKIFWRSWNANYSNKSANAISIEGCLDNQSTANKFKQYFQSVFIDPECDINARDEFHGCGLGYGGNFNKQLSIDDIAINTVEKCIKQLKPLKAAGFDNLTSEFLINAHESLALHLKHLFFLMLTHSYVPEAFSKGVIIPILKDARGDLSAMDNYRPITLSPVISKVFESFILEKYSRYFSVDPLQFGFSKGIGCSTTLFALRQVVQLFNLRGSNVYIASLDATKAFDRVNHYKLFSTLHYKGLPVYIINVIVDWYHKLNAYVKWNNAIYSTFKVTSGVRQGGILSPALFNCYVDSIPAKLRSLKLGCSLNGTYLGCLLYADDVLLLSSSCVELQKMLDVCFNVGTEIGIKLNAKKSMTLCIGPRHNTLNLACMYIGGICMDWVSKLKYLGVTILSNSVFKIDLTDTKRKFFASINSILSRCNYTSELVKLELFEVQCLPILLYCLDSIQLDKYQIN